MSAVAIQSPTSTTTWHMCRDALLRSVEGYVFQHSSMTPSTSNLQTALSLRSKLTRTHANHSPDYGGQVRVPEQVVQRVEVPDVELVVQRAAEADADEVACEEGQQDV